MKKVLIGQTVWICCTELIDSILIITCVAETNTDPIFFFLNEDENPDTRFI